MYRAKEQGRDRAELFDAQTHHRAVDDLRTGNALHRAIERGEMRVHYQPIIDLDSGIAVRLRGADPLGAPRARAGAADGVRAARRGDRPHRAARRRGRSSRRAAQAVRWHDAAPDGTATLDEREPLAPPARRARAAERRRRVSCTTPASQPGVALARDHREHADARRRVGAERARCAACARPAPRGRRLRLRLLVAGVPRAAPGRGAEDRPLVHRGRRASSRTAPRSSTRS